MKRYRMRPYADERHLIGCVVAEHTDGGSIIFTESKIRKNGM